MTEFLERVTNLLRGNWALKLTALGLAFLLWSVVRAETHTRNIITEVPVRVVLRDADWVVYGEPVPPTVSVVVGGPTRELVRLRWQGPEVVVPIDQVSDSTEVHVLRNNWVVVPGGIDDSRVALVEDIRPSTVRIRFDRLHMRLIPVAVMTSGTLPPGFELAGPITIEPPVVAAHGASRRFDGLDALALPPISLGTLRAPDTATVQIDTTGLGLIVSPRTVRVIVPVRAVPDTLDDGATAAAMLNGRPASAQRVQRPRG
jgi:YbbR domain-containing protein